MNKSICYCTENGISSTVICQNRTISAVTLRDSNPLPRMDEFIVSRGSMYIFSNLSAQSRYWRVKDDERRPEKAAHTSHGGPTRFHQRCMDWRMPLPPLKGQSTSIYSQRNVTPPWNTCGHYHFREDSPARPDPLPPSAGTAMWRRHTHWTKEVFRFCVYHQVIWWRHTPGPCKIFWITKKNV